MLLFEYRFDKITDKNPPFEETVDYILKVPCENRPDILDYVFRSYQYGEWLYITDIFPKMYADDPKCFKRFTSHEKYFVNMRRLAVTCVYIFVKEFMTRQPLSVMVISGSYEVGEKEEGPSRKLKLYQYFFRSILRELNLRAVDMLDKNAFMLVRDDSPLADSEIFSKYLEFKSNR